MPKKYKLLKLLAPGLCLVISGCSLSTTAPSLPELGSTIRGHVHGGQQPVVGARVYLLQASGSYGSGSYDSLYLPLQSDSIGGYVVSDANGAFSITGDYTCTPGSQSYIYTSGGNSGAGVNSAVSLMAVLGTCPASGTYSVTTPFIWVDEVTTVAAAYALSGFAVDSTHVANGTFGQPGSAVSNAFATAGNLASIANGSALSTTPSGTGTVPQALINTLADILASCVNTNSASSAACNTLFSNARSGGTSGTLPADTASAMINIAHNPAANVHTLYNLAASFAPFVPTLPIEPADFTLAIIYTPPGTSFVAAPQIDAAGNVWMSSSTNGLSEISPLGVVTPVPFTAFASNQPVAITIDRSGYVWSSGTFSKLDGSGTYGEVDVIFTTGAFAGACNSPDPYALTSDYLAVTRWGLNSAGTVAEYSSLCNTPYVSNSILSGAKQLAVNRGSVAFATEPAINSLAVLSESYTTVSATQLTGGGLDGPTGIAFDFLGNLWISNSIGNSLSEFIFNSVVPTNPTGTFANSTGFFGGGLSNPQSIAIDGLGNVGQ